MDHPRDNEPWAWASYNTSGLVVPVFSNNVHEVRWNSMRCGCFILFGSSCCCFCIKSWTFWEALVLANHSPQPIPTLHSEICPSSPHFQVRSYNRLAPMARGDYLILAADDDMPPTDCEWLQRVVRIFDKYPQAGILGIRNYVTW